MPSSASHARRGSMGGPLLRCMVVAVFFLLMLCSNGELSPPDVITWDDLRVTKYPGSWSSSEGADERVIVVNGDGSGDSRTVQGAVDMVRDGNRERVKVVIFPGFYREKVVIPRRKSYISFIGNHSATTIMSWNAKASDEGPDGRKIGTYDSASVAVESDYFCATGITFENSAPSAEPGEDGMQAVALRVTGDKAVFIRCRILDSQDTLFDNIGRHYFSECFIQGSIDFIFGSARSLYQSCILNADSSTFGAVAASQRSSTAEDSGFLFVNCRLTGRGNMCLGRAWGRYARVVYANCQLDGIVRPEGWDDYGDSSRWSTVTFGEYNCHGAGADVGGRVPWGSMVSTITSTLERYLLDQCSSLSSIFLLRL